MAPSLDEKNFDDVYDVKRHIKLGNDRRVMVLGWPEFDVNNKECAIESTRAAAFSLVNHSENPNCALEARETYAPTWDSKSKFVWYELTIKSLTDLASRVEVTIAYSRAP
ncbi:unnamed protein product [Ascophyllum nodosum]